MGLAHTCFASTRTCFRATVTSQRASPLIKLLVSYRQSFQTKKAAHSFDHSLSPHVRRFQTSIVCAVKDPRTAIKRITRDDVTVSFARSSGAGGQNVNKVNTKVDMRLNLGAVTWLDDDVKEEIKRKEKRRMNKEGELVLTSQRTRSQADNVEDALEKLQEILDAAWVAVQPIEEDPEKKKQLEKQKKIANENRLKEKKLHQMKKKDRRSKIEW